MVAVPMIAFRGPDGWGGLPTEGVSSPGCSGLQQFSHVTSPCLPQSLLPSGYRGRGWGVGCCWRWARVWLAALASLARRKLVAF